MTFADIVSLWPSIEDLARDVGATPDRAYKWRARDNIPAEYWQRLIDSGANRGIEITPEQLVALASAKQTINGAADQ